MKNFFTITLVVVSIVLILLTTCTGDFKKDDVIITEHSTKEVTTEVETEETVTEEIVMEVTTKEAMTEIVTEKIVEEDIPTNRWDITLNRNEIKLLEQITFLEAGNQSDEGMQAVVEVILNRMHSEVYPNDLTAVLSQNGQFSTWSYRTSANVTYRVKSNVEKVLDGNTNILPFETLYFSTSPLNNKVQEVIGAHYFCNQ